MLVVVRKLRQLAFDLLIGNKSELPWLAVDRGRTQPDNLFQLLYCLIVNLFTRIIFFCAYLLCAIFKKFIILSVFNFEYLD